MLFDTTQMLALCVRGNMLLSVKPLFTLKWNSLIFRIKGTLKIFNIT